MPLLRWLLALGPTNPLAVRLVQGGSRRLRHLYIRAGYLAVLIIALLASLLGGGLEAQNFRDLAAAGAQAFEFTAYLQVGLICILAPVFMAGAIAQESNPRTWDILLTTPLSAVQLVIGTLAGRLFFVLALLAASLPLFAVTQYFGGVPGSAVLLSYAIAGTAAILVGAIAVTLAVNRLAGRRAVFAFYVAVVTYLAVTFVADNQLQPAAGGVTLATPLNPFLALTALLRPSTYPIPEPVQLAAMNSLTRFWLGSPVAAWCALSAGLSLALIAASTLGVRRVNAGRGVPWYRRLFGIGASGALSRPPRTVTNNPIAWREASARAATLPKLLTRWGFILTGALWGAGLVAFYDAELLSHQSFRLLLLATVWTELSVVLLVAINMSATAVTREREDGTLDLLLTTPITPKDYLGGKLKGLILYLMPFLAVPLGTLLVAGAYVLTGGIARTDGVLVTTTLGTANADLPVVLPEIALLTPLVTLPFTALCVMIGLQRSLKRKGTIGAVLSTVATLAVLLGVVGVCGYQAASEIPYLGPALAAANPMTLVWALGNPGLALGGQAVSSPAELPNARAAIAFGATVAALGLAAVVAAMRAGMVRTFDRTTRELAGLN